MRVITGSARGMALKAPKGMDTRPTMDQVKEGIFSAIQFEVEGRRVLDLFAGSGQMGIEALSRGAACAYFIENNKLALDCIHHNITHTRFDDEAFVLPGDVIYELRNLEGRMQFDIIFIDPPYHGGYEHDVLETIAQCNLLAEDGYVIVEADLHTDFTFVTDLGYQILNEKDYKTNKHVFLAKDE